MGNRVMTKRQIGPELKKLKVIELNLGIKYRKLKTHSRNVATVLPVVCSFGDPERTFSTIIAQTSGHDD